MKEMNPSEDFRSAIESTPERDWGEGTLQDLAHQLRLVQEVQRSASVLAEMLAMDIAERMEADSVEIPGIGKVTRRYKESSAWLSDGSREQMLEEAGRAIALRVSRDPATGEVHQPIMMAVREAVRLVEETLSIGATPKAAFKKMLGLDPSMYRVKVKSGYTIKLEGESL